MKLPALALFAGFACLAASAAHAQQFPVGSGLLAFEERLAATQECEAFTDTGLLLLSVFPDGSFRVQNDVGTFRGLLHPLDRKGRAWNLRFDASSLHFYRLYLEAGVRALCRREAFFEGGGVESFVLRFSKGGAQASLRLAASGASPALGKVRARHLLKGRGPWALGVLPAPAPGAGGTITLIPPDRSGGGAVFTMLRLADVAAEPEATQDAAD